MKWAPRKCSPLRAWMFEQHLSLPGLMFHGRFLLRGPDSRNVSRAYLSLQNFYLKMTRHARPERIAGEQSSRSSESLISRTQIVTLGDGSLDEQV